jgi:PfaD family protein
MGAAYVLTGSINQSSVEANVSPAAKALLAQAGMADMSMAPAADMFEYGVKLQVLKRGTLFAVRAAKLYDLYTRYSSLDEIPAEERGALEKSIFRLPLAKVWQETLAFWTQREPKQAERALRDPKHKMALTFRWYLGQASRWAINGAPDRVEDYQIWCGPAMGGFNSWVKGSFLEKPESRSVVQIALNLLEGAAVVTRTQQLRTLGVPVPQSAFDYRPQTLLLPLSQLTFRTGTCCHET